MFVARRCALVLCSVALGCGRVGFDDRDDGSVTPDSAVADAPDGSTGSPSTNFVQVAGFTAGMSPDATLAFAGDVTTGNLILVSYSYSAAAAFVPTVSDTQGNAFSYLPVGTFAGSYQGLAYAIANASGPNTATVTFNGTSSTYIVMWVVEYAGRSVLDASSFAGGTTMPGDTTARVAVTTTQSNELLVGIVVGGGQVNAGVDFTLRSNEAQDVMEDRLAPTPGTYDVTAELEANNFWLATAAVFR